MIKIAKLVVGLLLSSITFLACSTMNTNVVANVSYLDSVKQNYEAGERALTRQAYDEAIAFFEHIRSKYPYSKYAALSDLRLADAYFYKKKWLEAADAYDFYLRFHPRHEQNPYAWFQTAKSYYNLRPSTFFILPAPYLKDLTPTNEALAAINRFLLDFPTHEKAEEAKEMKVKLRLDLASREMSIGQFYEKRNKWSAAFSRYENVTMVYADTTKAPEALFKAAHIAENKLNKADVAYALLEKIVTNHKESQYFKEAEVKYSALQATASEQ